MLGAAALAALSVQAQERPAGRDPALPEVVVTTVADHSPVTVVADPKQPRQPIPASDAADFLKTIPGFSAIRSGGSNSDPVFRGQFGSRLPILTNGTTMLGACPARMDAPSSYISPETFDELTVVKGPQTVLWGPGASAGVVRFDRNTPDFSEPGIRFSGSLTAASAGRNDQVADVSAGNASVYGRVTANHSHGQDYKDGHGQTVPSKWDKWNSDVALGLTPDRQTVIELSAGAGDGEARYGGRSMDGTQFRRRSAGLRFEKSEISETLAKVEAQLYYNHADHVMDNYTLRTPPTSGMMAGGMASNVDRRTLGGRTALTWRGGERWQLVSGLDFQVNQHRARSGTPTVSYREAARVRDAKFSDVGLFGELSWQLAPQQRLISGLRLDHAQAWRYPSSTMSGMAMSASTGRNRRGDTLPAGFVRWERDLSQWPVTLYAGLGHVQRFPDYWELIAPGNSAAASGNAFETLRPEKTTQLDFGAQLRSGDWQAWASAYVGYVQDFILFDYASAMGGMSSTSVRNVNAETAGGEIGVSRRLSPAWSLQGTLAYAWARNASDHRPLPQIPPLEGRLGLNYEHGPWSAGALWRLVAAQHRTAIGQGNVVGQDFGSSGGFGVLSLNAGYALQRGVKLVAGVDNLLGKRYAEHLNLAGSSGFGYGGSTAINEPGRTVWVRADFKY